MKITKFYFFVSAIMLLFTFNIIGFDELNKTSVNQKLRVFSYPKSPLATWIGKFHELAKQVDSQLLPNHFFVKGLDLDPQGNLFPKKGWLKIYKTNFPVQNATYDVLLNCEAKFDAPYSTDLVPKIMAIVEPKLKTGNYINAFIDCEPISIQAPFVTDLATSINSAGYGVTVYMNPKYATASSTVIEQLLGVLANNKKNSVCIAEYGTELMQSTEALIGVLEHRNIPYYICLDLSECTTQDIETIINSLYVHQSSPLFQGLSIFAYDNDKVLFADAAAKMDLINKFYSKP